MNPIYGVLAASAIILVASISGCSKKEEMAVVNKEEMAVDEGTEESNVELTLTDTYDKIRNGARLILNYDAKSNAFKGTVENTTDETLKRVRVEVHLSNGKELGPTTPGDLAPSEKREILLTATTTDFDKWTAHPEVGEDEHGSGRERGEHDREGDSEHGAEGDSEHDGEGDEHN